MGVKKVWDKLVGTVGGVNEDDEFETDEYEDEEEMEEEHGFISSSTPFPMASAMPESRPPTIRSNF